MERQARDYELLEEQMNVTAKLLDAREAVQIALEASRRTAGLLEAAAMQKRREERQTRER